MWLLNATTETQRRGLADYFSPTIAIARVSGGGDGALGGDSILAEDSLAFSGRGGSSTGTGASSPAPGMIGGDQGMALAQADEDLAELESAFLAMRGESLESELALQHVVTRITDEGLIVEMFDLPGQPLFDPESDRPMPVVAMIADLLSDAFGAYANGLSIEGHTRSYPLVLMKNPIWGLSSARSQSMRGLLEIAGLDADRMQRVTGHADRRPAVLDRSAVRNNRLEVILLRNRQ